MNDALTSELAPAEVVNQLAAHMMQRRFTVQNKAMESITFTQPQRPNRATALIMVAIGVGSLVTLMLPGLLIPIVYFLYWAMVKKTVTTSVVCFARAEGGTSIAVSGDDEEGVRMVREYFQAVPEDVRGPLWSGA